MSARAGAGTLALVCLLAVAATAAAPAAAAAQDAIPPDPPAVLAGPTAVADGPARVDLNRASLAELLTLPLPPEVARRILDYRLYVRYYESVYDLLEVEGVDAELFARLKPLVTTLPPGEQEAAMVRLEASYRQLSQFLSQEGANEGLVDEFVDQLRDPVNINNLDLFDLMAYPNVSPVDATAILKAKRRLGGFEDTRQLRQSDGLRYWAYRNLRDFIGYRDEGAQGLRGSYQVRYWDSPYSSDEMEIAGGYTGVLFNLRPASDPYDLGQELPDPFMTHKLRVSATDHLQAGLLTSRNMGEASWRETMKGFVGLQHLGDRERDLELKRLVLGNYRVAFGQGLVMDNTDFVLYRKTGQGYNKRPQGVRGDLSRSQEYALFGGAAEGRAGPVLGTLFVSTGKKDAILNADGTINRYVTMYPRPPADYLNRLLAARRSFALDPPDSVKAYLAREGMDEDILGGNLRLILGDGSYIGFSGYEARHNRGFLPVDPRDGSLSALIGDDDFGQLATRDSEIYNAYRSVFTGADSTRISYDFRRVFGTDFQMVWRNYALMGEYAWLQDPRASFLHGYAGDAYLVSGWAQWDDLNLQAIWRDYDVGFDNPYNRAFSNDTRYEQTLLDAPYRLDDDHFAWLSTETPQPKPERGLFLDARYRISRTFTLTNVQYDQWERKADGMDMRRYTLRAEYQPIFNLRFRVRHRFSSRSEQLPEDVRRFRSWETRWEVVALLSNYNALHFQYGTSNVEFPPRQRLSYPPEPGGGLSGVGMAAQPGHFLGVDYRHNLTPRVTLLTAAMIYDGFLWGFEANEFVTMDGKAFRTLLALESRIGSNLLMQMKVTRDHDIPRTYVDLRDFGDPLGLTPEGTRVGGDDTTFRLQMDYTF